MRDEDDDFEAGPGEDDTAPSGLTEDQLASAEVRIFRALNASRDIDAFKDVIVSVLKDWKFDTFSYINIGHEGKRLDGPKWVLTTLPDALIDAYWEAGYYPFDVMFDYAFHNQAPAFYSKLVQQLMKLPYESELKRMNRDIAYFYRTFGFGDFYLLPLHRDGRHAVMGVGCTDASSEQLIQKVHATETVQIGIAEG